MQEKFLKEKEFADALKEKLSAKWDIDHTEAWSRIEAYLHCAYGLNFLAECKLNLFSDLIRPGQVVRMDPDDPMRKDQRAVRDRALFHATPPSLPDEPLAVLTNENRQQASRIAELEVQCARLQPQSTTDHNSWPQTTQAPEN